MTFDDSTLLLLTHIPKCAGTSFRLTIVIPNISKELIYSPERGWRDLMTNGEDFAYLVGHFETGIEKLINPLSPARRRRKLHITFLREPLDQMISYVSFMDQLKHGSPPGEIQSEQIIECYIRNPHLRNMQTRFCAGFILNHLTHFVDIRYARSALLWRAKQNLVKKFDFVGSFESLESDLRYLCEQLHFEYRPIHEESTRTKNRLSVDELTMAERNELIRLNPLDFELYEFARRFLWERRDG